MTWAQVLVLLVSVAQIITGIALIVVFWPKRKSSREQCREVMDRAMEDQSLSKQASDALRRVLKEDCGWVELTASTSKPVELSRTDNEYNR